MQIWPAIDLRGGLCVRLEQGDFARETVFGDDPAAIARHWVGQGADRLHIVDLDGARLGKRANREAIEAIIRSAGVSCQVGGGIRDEAAIRDLIELGASRLVLGSAALANPEWFRSMCQAWPGRLCLGLDTRDGFVAVHGWHSTTGIRAGELVERYASEPLAAVIYTDIATDGMERGPNFDAVAELAASMSIPIIASGGVSRPEDVARLAGLGAAGCIIGKSLYTGRLSLRDVLTASAGRVPADAGTKT
jgi:phosphoribosylformimino-5-aminoimidazole carboxamide ribotide isomerase